MRLHPPVVAAILGVALANDPAPVAFDPGDWLGIDGNWSTIKVLLGSSSDLVNVLVSTSLSEFWAIGPGGCLAKEPHCIAARGGIYSPLNSKHWSPLGTWQLGLNYLGYGGNGQYGLDTVNAYSTITDIGFGMSDVLMSAINTTDYFIGLFGLGISQGNFGREVVKSPLTQAVETFGWIPSYSYGYTAGAHYRNTPVSITLGGHDTSRYVPHGTQFTLSQQDNMPRTLVRGIEVSVANDSAKPKQWQSQQNILTSWNNSFTALIDSTTPYLWLPEDVCDQFASAFNLTYNSTFDLYTITNNQYTDYSTSGLMNFTFSLSSIDNNDNFGSPLEVPGLINITLPVQAFVSLLQYPFQDEAIKYGDPAVPYFALRKSQNSSAIILGRTFLQESYLITKYDEAVFSIHQARFPARPFDDAELLPIKQSHNSPLPPPPSVIGGDKLTTVQMVGIAVGVVVLCLLCVLSLYCICHRGKPRQKKSTCTTCSFDETKDTASTLVPDTPRSPVATIFSKITGRKRAHTTGAQSSRAVLPQAAEVPDSEIYELPAPMAPVELDASDGADDTSVLDNTVLVAEDTQNLSTYEIARRKIDRQLRGPVPEYSPPVDGTLPLPEKVTTQGSGSIYSQPTGPVVVPVSPFKSGSGTDSISRTLPSPISPRAENNSHSENLPSPIMTTEPSGSSASDSDSFSPSDDISTHERSRRSNSAYSGTTFPTTDPYPPMTSMGCQKTPIDPTSIVCMGPLPDHIQSLRQSIILARMVEHERRNSFTPMFNAESQQSQQSLGSNYTEEEERIVQELTRQETMSMGRQSETNQTIGSDNSQGQERVNGNDLIHIPQVAQKRYSWE